METEGLEAMTRSIWIAIAAVVALVLIVYFAADIWHAIWLVLTWTAGWTAYILVGLWITLMTVIGWLWTLLGAALQVAMPFLVSVVTFVVVVGAFVLGVGFLIVLSLMLAGYIGARLKEVGQQVHELRNEFRAETGRAGRDAAFLALITAICGLVAYMGTEEFLRHMSTVRFLAVSCIGLVVAKIFLFFPSRIPKFSGILLTFAILVGSIMFIGIRYQLAAGFAHLREVVMDPENQLKLMLAAIMSLFSLLTLLFPFTATEWRQLLAAPRSLLPDPSAANVSHVVALGQEGIARIEHRQE